MTTSTIVYVSLLPPRVSSPTPRHPFAALLPQSVRGSQFDLISIPHPMMDRSNPHLGLNKLGRNIRKATPPPPPPHPHVYNVSKNQFRDIVQQLTTGSPSAPPHPKPPSMRLQKIRPPPIATPVARPPPLHNHQIIPDPNPVFHRPPPPQPMPVPGSAWADSPVSAYMRFLENSLFSATPPGAAAAGAAAAAGQAPPPVPSPGILPSPSGFLNLLSPTPRSPYPLLSPAPPLTPNFPVLSPLPGTGILGPGPMPPSSPGLWFPQSPSGLLSPSGFLPIFSPRWRDM